MYLFFEVSLGLSYIVTFSSVASIAIALLAQQLEKI